MPSKEAQSKQARGMAINKIIHYMLDEKFPLEHISAIHSITTLFSVSEESETDVFTFADNLRTKYARSIADL